MRDKHGNCNKCGGAIIDQRCACRVWYEKDNYPQFMKAFENALETFNDLDLDIFAGNDCRSGLAFVFFRGDTAMCDKVEDYIKRLRSSSRE